MNTTDKRYLYKTAKTRFLLPGILAGTYVKVRVKELIHGGDTALYEIETMEGTKSVAFDYELEGFCL